MKLLLQYLVRYKGLVLLALLLAAVDQVFINLNPWIFGTMLVDPFASRAAWFRENGLDTEFFTGIGRGLLLIVGASTVAWISKGFQNYTVNRIIKKLGADLYADVQHHTLSLPYQHFEDERSGEVLSLLQKARQDCELFITKFVNVAFTSFIALTMVVVIAYRLSPLLPVIYCSGAVLLIFVTSFLSRKIRSLQKEILKETNALAGSTTESLRNMELIKSLGLTRQETRRLNETNFSILENELKKIRKVRSISFVYGAFIQTLHQVIMFLLLVTLFYDKLTVGQLFSMQIYFYFVFGQLGDLSSVVVAYQEVSASLGNLHQILSKRVEHVPDHPSPIGPLVHLRFDKVSFQYKSAVRPALDNISFEASTGDTIAFAGPSGSGKTTLVKLLVGLYNPDTGKINYNGHEHGTVHMDELRHQIGMVTQDAQLFSGTIRENLLFVNPEATDKMMEEALRKASCQSLLARAPEGWHTLIGEGGLKLSGGEKQRLAIARSLLRASRMLIFDEATSSLDSLTEKEIADTVRQITAQQQYITVMIAHRLSTIMFADCIYVLERGRIIETGNHASLLAQKGLYHAMWRQQTGEWKDEPVPTLEMATKS